MKKLWKSRLLPVLLSVALVGTLMTGCTQNATESQENQESESQQESVVEESATEETAPEETQPEEEEEAVSDVTLHVAGLKGPTGMGMAKLMEDAANGKTANQYEFVLESAPDAVVGKLTSGELDIAAVPVNLAATLYQKTQGGVQLAAVNTLGVLYVVENGDTISSVSDLEGKTIYATGQASTPEYVLNYILEKNGLTPGENVTVEYLTEHAELAASFLAGECDVAMLPEPFVTQVMSKSETANVVLDLTKEWEAVAGDTLLAMGGIVVRSDFAKENPQAVAQFLEEYQASVEYVTDEANADDAAALIEKYDIMVADVAKNALPRCNIVFMAGDEMKASAEGFLQVVFEADPQAIGGALPEDDFYLPEED